MRQIEAGFRLGASELKEYKPLGLSLKDNDGKRVAIDDPTVDPVWNRCRDLEIPVSIQVVVPVAF